MSRPGDRPLIVAALRHAVPYIRLFKGKTFVLKAGGAAFADSTSTRQLLQQVGILYQLGIRIVLVHGGGPQSTSLAGRLGVASTFVDGRRVTDELSLDVATMVLNGQLNTRILAVCHDLEIPAIGMSGVDAGLIRAHRRPPVRNGNGAAIDYGHVGDIDAVDPAVIEIQLDNGLVPVISSLCCDADGNLLNVNADTVAAAIAGALRAEKLILATGAAGILDDPADSGSLVSYLDRNGLARMRDAGKLVNGMLPKAAAADAALGNGVQRVHVISYAVADSLLLEIFTNEGTGTMIVNDIAALSPAEQSAMRR